MKNFKKTCAAFTLVEMLVVIAIISLVALAMTRAIRGAQRQANATKCQANMKTLHTAAVAYLADKSKYPFASSYETVDRHYHTVKVVTYKEYRGWVSWIPKSQSGDQNPWHSDSGHSHAKEFYYPKITDKRMPDAIRAGTLFKYTQKNPTVYRCPEHARSTAKDDEKGKVVHLAYAMNCFFNSYNNRSEYAKTPAFVKDVDSSRMALFIEIDEGQDTESGTDRDGTEGGEEGGASDRFFSDDACWTWSKTSAELGSRPHRKAGVSYGHVVFLDGHVESIEDDSVETFKKLGEGSY